MFRIPAFYKFETTLQDAVTVMTSYGRGDLLEGMKAMDRVWDEHCSGSDRFDGDSDFYDNYEAEVNAYNKIFTEMQPVFA
jgi:hypothetical protein